MKMDTKPELKVELVQSAADSHAGRTRLARNRWGWIILILNLLAAFNSMAVFLGLLKVGFVGWLMLNTCSPIIFFFAAGYLARSRPVTAASALLMFRYGTLGFFTFGWSGTNLIAQTGHFLMTLAVIYTVWEAVKSKAWRDLIIGAAIGAALIIALEFIQGAYFNAHPGLVEQLFRGQLTPQP